MRRNDEHRPKRSGETAAGRFRIISGEWRGRRLEFPALPGVRPTGDRVRETLFNWLQPVVPGARCLDLFAGSGALGLEALSRGAAEVVFVDREPRLAQAIKAHLSVLDAEAKGRVLCSDARKHLEEGSDTFDIVFLDPPFGESLVSEFCQRLTETGRLSDHARVYLETESGSEPDLPAGWRLLRSARAGNVGYHLASGGDAP